MIINLSDCMARNGPSVERNRIKHSEDDGENELFYHSDDSGEVVKIAGDTKDLLAKSREFKRHISQMLGKMQIHPIQDPNQVKASKNDREANNYDLPILGRHFLFENSYESKNQKLTQGQKVEVKLPSSGYLAAKMETRGQLIAVIK